MPDRQAELDEKEAVMTTVPEHSPSVVGAVPAGGLLAVHAHPDDETLATGGLLATWAAAGETVTLVTCTRGEQGEVIGDDPDHLEGDGPRLAEHREAELAAALDALGVHDHAFLDTLPVPHGSSPTGNPARYEDSGMAWVGEGDAGLSGQAGAAEALPAGALVGGSLDEQASRLAELVRVRRPDVVVTYEPGGGYGHPDHVRAHQITMRAVELAAHASTTAAAHRPREVWWAVQPPAELRAARARLAEVVRTVAAAKGVGNRGAGGDDLARGALPDPAGPLPAVASGHDEVAVTVDTRPVLDRVEAALRAHATQVHLVTRFDVAPAAVTPGGGEGPALVGTYALSNDVLVPWLGVEHYARAPRPLPDDCQPASSDER